MWCLKWCSIPTCRPAYCFRREKAYDGYFVSALTQVVQPLNTAVILLGTIVGILAGAMPGLSSIMALTIVTPFTFSTGGNSGILMLLGVFCGAIYGGSITAI